ncbi:hypothetical protein EJB05_39525, partial [Eragrostis curvula]
LSLCIANSLRAPDPGAATEEKAVESSCEVMEEFVMGDHARLVDSMRLAKELAASSTFFAKLSELFATDPAFRRALERVRGDGGKRLRVVAYGLVGTEYSWVPRFRLAVLLLLRDAFPEAIGTVEVVFPIVVPVERRALEELGCVVSASVQQCRLVHEPTLIFMPYADRVFFENLLILNWSADQLGKIVMLGHSFDTMVNMLDLSMEKQEMFGVTKQREKVRRILAIQKYVREIALCPDFVGLLDNPLLGGGLEPLQESDEDPDEAIEDRCDRSTCKCMHCIAHRERQDMMTALPSHFSVHLFRIDPEIDMECLVPGNCTTRVWSTVNIQMKYDPQFAGWHLNPSEVYIEDKNLTEAESIVKEVHETMIDVRSSSLYTKFIDHMKENPSIRDRISSMLGDNECMELVIYGPGSFEFDVGSQFQLAFILLLKEAKIFPVGDIEIYDPALSPADVKACFDLGIRVLLVNEQCRRSVEKPTLFFVPGLALAANVMETNFYPKQLNKMIIVSYGFKENGKSISHAVENMNYGDAYVGSLAFERNRFMWASMDYIHEVIVMEKFDKKLWALSGLNHVASLRIQLEERISRPFNEDQCDCKDDNPRFWGQVFRHRLPAMNRTTWSPPPKGWIKLNFHGIGCSQDYPACIGGILHNDNGEVLSYYAAPIGEVDQIMASCKALERGLELMVKHHEPVRKLIIEGDNLTVIRWFNGITQPPERVYHSVVHSLWHMALRRLKEAEALAPAKASEECNKGEDKGAGSSDDKKEKDDTNGIDEDGDGSQGTSSKFFIPPEWVPREYISWHVEEAANQVAIGLAHLGPHLRGGSRYLSVEYDCGYRVGMEKDRPDLTWFIY